jgi:hypothetical protein
MPDLAGSQWAPGILCMVMIGNSANAGKPRSSSAVD